MTATNTCSRGSSSVVVASVLVLVVVLGLVGWRLYENQKVQSQDSDVKNTTNTTSPAAEQHGVQAPTDPNAGYVVIKDWGVRFKPAEGLNDVTYFRSANTPNSYDRLDLTTQELANREAGCKSRGFSSITRTTTQQKTMYESLLTKIGDYYYYYRGSDAACSSTATNATFEVQQRSLVKESVQTLEAAK